jgi:LmbE family N-acetylglucosaminyl deacetylase
MKWIYLSPHLDDVALSIGGLLWTQSQAGISVSVWTICAGDAPAGQFSPFAESLQNRWDTGADSMSIRRGEDLESCSLMGAEAVHFNIPDCIYRRSSKNNTLLYDSEQALWSPVHPDEGPLINKIAAEMAGKLESDDRVVCPMTLGKHVDHRLTRLAAEHIGIELLFYPDYPYVLRDKYTYIFDEEAAIQVKISERALLAWQAAVAAHQSQISTFWHDLNEMRLAIRSYSQNLQGVKLFK